MTDSNQVIVNKMYNAKEQRPINYTLTSRTRKALDYLNHLFSVTQYYTA